MTKPIIENGLLPIVCWCGLLLLACLPAMESEEVKGEPPVERIVFSGSTIAVYPTKGHSWQELVDLNIFGDFEPGMDFDSARATSGAPDEIGENRLGPFYRYSSPAAQIVVALEKHSSGDSAYTDWRLHAYPSNRSPSAHFHREIVNHLAGRITGQKRLVVMHPDHYGPAVWGSVEDGEVTSVTWYQK